MSCGSCQGCSVGRVRARPMGVNLEKWDAVVALAGNPNTGKSTVFNWLTGLRQHTGNWPGKTIARAEGGFSYAGRDYKIVDLPGTYSLLSASPDEEVARDFVLFGRPNVTVVVTDATALERNLNLVLQILQITDRVVVCLNLMDEARAHLLEIDVEGLEQDLGVPVVPCAVRQGEGINALLSAIDEVATGTRKTNPCELKLELPGIEKPVDLLCKEIAKEFPDLPHRRWIALRLLSGDRTVCDAIESGEIGNLRADHAAEALITDGREPEAATENAGGRAILQLAERLKWRLPPNMHDQLTERIYSESSRIAGRRVRQEGASPRLLQQRRIDKWLTNPFTGYPLMLLIFAAVLWITIEGANIPSNLLSVVLLEKLHPLLRGWAEALNAPGWLIGLTIDGMYVACAWVVSVMLPPMAIFFPLFTILEDLGYLPRVAFNLDRAFQAVGAHGKQALTMSMGLGCNAAGVIACRIIDSPRERLIAILTNNFALCNGRWPTQILIATIFLGALAPPALAGITAAGAVLAVALFGFALTFLCSWALSRTLLRGEASTFSLELPPYRPPNILRTLYTSIVDRTLFVLWRAIVFAVPAGAVIWLVANVSLGGMPLAQVVSSWLDPLGWCMGLSGLILLAYIVAIPANEIVIPTILMLSVQAANVHGMGSGAGVLFDADGAAVRGILVATGWTTLTAVCLMLFSLCHNPCSTTLYTIRKETGSWRWTFLAAAMPLLLGFVLCGAVAGVWRLLGG